MGSNLVINGRYQNRKTTGNERYAGEISRRLNTHTPLRIITPGKNMPILAGQFWEQIILPSRIKKDEILWSPANTGPLLVPNQVVTIHDTFIFDHPEWFQPSFRLLYRSLLPQLVKRAARIITVSNYSCNRLTDIFGLKINQVTSIPCGVDLDWFQPGSQTEIERVRQLYKIPGSYLLFIGSLEPRKNLARLVQAWKIVQKEYPHIMLVIAGGQSKRVHNSETLAESLGIKKIGYVCECDLPALYSGALGFLYPSLCEGFGLQILESMACGTPVLAANTGAFPEVVAEAGLLINPYDIEEIAYSICRMISEKDLREDLRLRGFQRARQFSWENTTNAIENVFEEVRQKITL